MGAIETKTFKHGNSIAVDLPDVLGVEPGERFTIERTGSGFTLKPIENAAEEKRKLGELMARLLAVGPITPVSVREPIEFPDRPGLC